MSISRAGTILAVAVTFAGIAPAFAGPNGWEYLNMMERLRQQRVSTQPTARADALPLDQRNRNSAANWPHRGRNQRR